MQVFVHLRIMSAHSLPELFVWYLMQSATDDECAQCRPSYAAFVERLSEVDKLKHNSWVGYVVIDRCFSSACVQEDGQLEEHWSQFLKRIERNVAPKQLFGYRIVHYEKFQRPIHSKPQRWRCNDFKLDRSDHNLLQEHVHRLNKHFVGCKLLHRGLVVDRRFAHLIFHGDTTFIYRPWKRPTICVSGMHF